MLVTTRSWPFVPVVVLVLSLVAAACDGPPTEPSPLPEGPRVVGPRHVLVDHARPDHRHEVLTVTISCSLRDCASLVPGSRVVFGAVATGGSGHYTFHWSNSAGTLYGSPGRDGSQRWIAPAAPGAAYITVRVADTARPDIEPVEAEIRVLVQASTETSTTSAGSVQLTVPTSVADGGRVPVSIAGGESPYTLTATAGGYCTQTDSPPCTGGVGLVLTVTVRDDTNLRFVASGTEPGDTLILDVTDAAGGRDSVIVTVT